MSAFYEHFMIFMLHDSGEKDQIDITKEDFTKENGKKTLLPEQVVLIVDEDLRRIYIWKGAQSSVRKKFIASRVASELQNQLANASNFHRCKVVSVDQGDEPIEFLQAFGFKSMEVDSTTEVDVNAQNMPKEGENSVEVNKAQIEKQKRKETIPYKIRKPNRLKILSQDQKNKLKSVFNTDVPQGFTRQHIMLGDNILYGMINKETQIFGEIITEESWGPIEGLDKEMIVFDDFRTRVYFDKETSIVNAVEFLKPSNPSTSKEPEKKAIDYSKWTVKELKAYCSKNGIKVPSKYRKAQIVKLVEDYTK